MKKDEIYLGISDSHDSGAALVDGEGRLLASINEERLNRRKMCSGWPALSIEALFQQTGIDPARVAAVGLAGKTDMGPTPTNNDFSDEQGRHGVMIGLAEFIEGVSGLDAFIRSGFGQTTYDTLFHILSHKRSRRIAANLEQLGIQAAVTRFDHHEAHLGSAYYASGLPESLVVSNDGFGDGLCCRVAVGQRGRLRPISANSFANSIGVYYNYVTRLCGFPKSHHAGKTTGLAAHGDPATCIDLFRELVRWDGDKEIYVNRGPIFRRAMQLLEKRLAGLRREDMAAGIQQHLEEILVAQIGHFVGRTGMGQVVLTGGIHANVKANQRIADIDGIERLFIFPNMGDGGLAAGAAWLSWRRNNPSAPFPDPIQHVYLGTTSDEREMEEAIRKTGLPFERPADLAEQVAQRLARGEVVARFDGAMEYGPRALGNRSILYDARDPGVNTWLNKQLGRTEFMPFAPVIRAEDGAEFIVGLNEVTAHAARFMTITYDVTRRCQEESPAVVHVDGTARPQIIDRPINPGYHDILTAFKKATGRSVLVNTSFNMHEEPIVCTAEDGMRAFTQGHLNAIAMGPFLVGNPDAPPPRK